MPLWEIPAHRAARLERVRIESQNRGRALAQARQERTQQARQEELSRRRENVQIVPRSRLGDVLGGPRRPREQRPMPAYPETPYRPPATGNGLTGRILGPLKEAYQQAEQRVFGPGELIGGRLFDPKARAGQGIVDDIAGDASLRSRNPLPPSTRWALWAVRTSYATLRAIFPSPEGL